MHKRKVAASLCCNVSIDGMRGQQEGFMIDCGHSDTNPTTKKTSLVCAECDGNGAKECSQCKGTGANSVDCFNGQFKAGGLYWLCRVKKEILCENCNGPAS